MPSESPYNFDFSWLTEVLATILNLITAILNPFLIFAVPVIADTFGISPQQVDRYFRVIIVIGGTLAITNTFPCWVKRKITPDPKTFGLVILGMACFICWNEFNIQEGSLRFMIYGLNTTKEKAFIASVIPSIIQWVSYLTTPAKNVKVLFDIIIWFDVGLTWFGYGLKRGHEPLPFVMSIRHSIHPVMTDLFMAVVFNHIIERLGVWSVQELVEELKAKAKAKAKTKAKARGGK
jgi:hypothetical protein